MRKPMPRHRPGASICSGAPAACVRLRRSYSASTSNGVAEKSVVAIVLRPRCAHARARMALIGQRGGKGLRTRTNPCAASPPSSVWLPSFPLSNEWHYSVSLPVHVAADRAEQLLTRERLGQILL